MPVTRGNNDNNNNNAWKRLKAVNIGAIWLIFHLTNKT